MNTDQIRKFQEDGYLIIPALFNEELMELLSKKCRHDRQMQDSPLTQVDSEGRISKRIAWTEQRDDLYGMISRSERLVNTAEALLEGEVYNWNNSIIHKEPEVGGAVEWHQDYPYWYKGGLLLPNVISCLVAIERANIENGCLQVLKGSHKMERIDLTVRGTEGMSDDKMLKVLSAFAKGVHNPDVQTGTDPERVEEAMKRFERVYCELEPGDTLFFHCNLLHASSVNESPYHRWLFRCTYNRADNEPYKKGSDGPYYTPIHKVSNDEILKVAREELAGV